MSDIQLLRVPKWGLSMEEGTIAAWLIAEGDSFSAGQEICEIETSKIANVMEAPFAGRLHRIVAEVGATLPVQAVIAVAAPEGASDGDIAALLAQEGGDTAMVAGEEAARAEETAYVPPAPGSTKSGANSPLADAVTQAVDDSASAGEGLEIPASLLGDAGDAALATPRAAAFAREHGIDLSLVPGSGRLDRVQMQDIRSAVRAAGGRYPEPANIPGASEVGPALADDAEIKASPVARRLAAKWGVPLAACRATGRQGRVSKADVEAARATIQGAASSAVTQPVAVSQEVHGEPVAAANSFTEIPMTGMRRTIAARLTESKREAPHFRVAVDVSVDALGRLRKQINEQHPGVKVSVNDFVIKAVAMALLRHPQCNIQFDGAAIRQFEHADVSVAVAMEAGLITPIVKNADRKTLVDISAEMRSLATRAKASTLTPDEFQGGTFTISNLGMFGVSQFDAIINPPQAAILAVGGARDEVRVQGGEVVATKIMSLNLASDHRVIDGALAAQFLQTVKRNLESPVVMLAG